MYTPQVTKKPTIHANNVKFANHFLFCTLGNGTLKIYSELRKIRTIRRPFALISQGSVYPVVKLPKFMLST